MAITWTQSRLLCYQALPTRKKSPMSRRFDVSAVIIHLVCNSWLNWDSFSFDFLVVNAAPHLPSVTRFPSFIAVGACHPLLANNCRRPYGSMQMQDRKTLFTCAQVNIKQASVSSLSRLIEFANCLSGVNMYIRALWVSHDLLVRFEHPRTVPGSISWIVLR